MRRAARRALSAVGMLAGRSLVKRAAQSAQSVATSLEKTMATGRTHFWSRSRRKLWMKGETSGHTQKIKSILVDCDYDALLFLVEQKGNVCHTGKDTCFYNKLEG
jgi:phosphoribosyl-AMP cyclohydrolase